MLPIEDTHHQMIHKMHFNFNQKYRKENYETYLKIFVIENIGFAAPSQDEYGVHKNII